MGGGPHFRQVEWKPRLLTQSPLTPEEGVFNHPVEMKVLAPYLVVSDVTTAVGLGILQPGQGKVQAPTQPWLPGLAMGQ